MALVVVDNLALGNHLVAAVALRSAGAVLPKNASRTRVQFHGGMQSANSRMPEHSNATEHAKEDMIQTGCCVHFTGVQNRVCKQGICYDNVPKPVACIFPKTRKAHPDFCAKYQEPTAEEIATDEAETVALLKRMQLVMDAIRPWRTWTKVNHVAKQEVVECPVCKGRLHLSQAAYNGHVHGKCETQGCVSWME